MFWDSVSDASGHYLVDIFENADPVTVSVQAGGYGGHFEDYDVPLRLLPEQKRRYVLSQRDDYRDSMRPLFSASQEVVPFNIVLIPESWLPQAQSAP
jgi:hypothetical protein